MDQIEDPSSWSTKPANASWASWLSSLSEEQRRKTLKSLPSGARTVLEYYWPFWASPAQIAPETGNSGLLWRLWLLLAGRGFGKTRTAVEWLRDRVQRGAARHINIVARTQKDLVKILIHGESGILAKAHPDFRPVWKAHGSTLTWPNGAVANTFTADEPDSLRGMQCDTFLADEVAAWRYPESWEQLMMGFRLQPPKGVQQGVAATTPRPTKLIKRLVKDPTVAVTRGTTFDNASNLPPEFIEDLIRTYGGTRLGRQELYAEILDDNPGALWRRSQIDDLRVKEAPQLVRVVVAVDPAVSDDEDSCETGIVVVGLGVDRHVYVLDDVSNILTPWQWANAVVVAYNAHKADRVIAEVNNGGNLVEVNLRTVSKTIPYKAIHASRGKRVRAEPVAALYERGVVHHVGCFPKLEDQQCDWNPTVSVKSPDRLDALVWGVTEVAGIQHAGGGRRNLSNLQRFV